MRWSNLTQQAESQWRLPGYQHAVVRHFDAPEALDMRFYEVHARSVLNQVPARSRMPFRWTINPYRGCSHACAYCLGPDTRLLMAAGHTKPIRDVQVGEWLYGTAFEQGRRRLVATRVLAKWSSIKPAYAVSLQDGTELIASGDHRFLTGEGWRYVTAADAPGPSRAHLTLSSELLGPGGCVEAPRQDEDYRRGYLCGLIRSEGYIGPDRCLRRGERQAPHRLTLALGEPQAAQRVSAYLRELSHAGEYPLAWAAGGHCASATLRSFTAAQPIEQLIDWPETPSRSWTKGFLAGVFDACGRQRAGDLRIASADPQIVQWVAASLRRLRFQHIVEVAASSRPLRHVRLCGGLAETMRFLLSTDPANASRRSLAGTTLPDDARLRVTAIRPLGVALRMYDITTGSEDFIAEGVVSHNCFARPTHTYLGFDAGRDFEREIVVKVNAPEVLRSELARPSWRGEHVALGTNTDPYQWVEGRYRLMEGIWEALRDAANPCSVLTKSPLLLRDLKLMLQIAQRAEMSACLSIPTLEEKAWRETEPHTPNPRARLEAVAELNRAGIPTGVLIAPLMPGINDAPHQVEPLVAAAIQAGAVSIGGIALHLRGEVKELFMRWLAGARPELLARYQELYQGGAYAPAQERERLARMVRRGPRRAAQRDLRSAGSGLKPAPQAPVAQPRSLQQTLF